MNKKLIGSVFLSYIFLGCSIPIVDKVNSIHKFQKEVINQSFVDLNQSINNNFEKSKRNIDFLNNDLINKLQNNKEVLDFIISNNFEKLNEKIKSLDSNLINLKHKIDKNKKSNDIFIKKFEKNIQDIKDVLYTIIYLQKQNYDKIELINKKVNKQDTSTENNFDIKTLEQKINFEKEIYSYLINNFKTNEKILLLIPSLENQLNEFSSKLEQYKSTNSTSSNTDLIKSENLLETLKNLVKESKESMSKSEQNTKEVKADVKEMKKNVKEVKDNVEKIKNQNNIGIDVKRDNNGSIIGIQYNYIISPEEFKKWNLTSNVSINEYAIKIQSIISVEVWNKLNKVRQEALLTLFKILQTEKAFKEFDKMLKAIKKGDFKEASKQVKSSILAREQFPRFGDSIAYAIKHGKMPMDLN